MANALRLIAENKRTKAKFLDLGNCGLTKVPEEIRELVWLESLSCASLWYEWDGRNWQRRTSQNTGDPNELLSDLTPLAGLTALKELYLSNTQVSDLAPLAGLTALQTLSVYNTQVSDLSPLAGLLASRTLDLRRTDVNNLTPLAGLTALQTLSTFDTQVSDLTPLAGLTALQNLNVSYTQVSDLTPLAGLTALQNLNVSYTQVSDLSPLAGLTALQTLSVDNTQVSDLSPLGGLTTLQTLILGNTGVSDLAPLAGLTALQDLIVSYTQVSDLTPLAGLTDLQTLEIWGTHVDDLTPLAGLTDLQTLEISGTQVGDLSPVIALIRRGLLVESDPRASWHVRGIHVVDCPLTNPPPEIVKQGNDAILNYFAEREKGGVDHLYEAKMLILGEGGAGKTSLLRRLYWPGQQLPTEKETTRGIDIYPQKFTMKNGQPFRLNVWDFGGQEIYHATHQFFLTRRSLYVLLDDTRKDYKWVQDEGFKYWLELIEIFGGHSPILIFQNEKDGRSKAIDFEGIQRRYDNVKKLYAGDLAKANAADKVRKGIEDFAGNLPHIGDEVPARWLQVRADIEQLAAKEPYVQLDKYFEIYGRHIDFDETKARLLSRYLHDLGVFLHFQDDPLLDRTVILQNEWATKAVFRVLDDETIKKAPGRFTHSDCARLWKDPAYARKHLELLALMQNFELCYELRDTSPQTWLIPQLLPPTKPQQLADWGMPEDLVLRYKYDFLPKGMISRLTVRQHRFVHDPRLAWVTGVLFERDTTAVLAQILEKGGEIELRARGPESKELLSVVAADLDALNESFQGLRGKSPQNPRVESFGGLRDESLHGARGESLQDLRGKSFPRLLEKVDKLIPCHCKACGASAVPGFFDQKALLKRKQDNRLKVECPRSYEMVDVLELLDGIRLDTLPNWANEAPGASSPAPVAAPPHTIRIFLASSSELREDRDAFDLYFRQQNDQLRKEGAYLEIVRWENFLDAMSETRLQDEYNEAIRNCDIFVSLFFTKTGKFTKEEFCVAHRQFLSSRKPSIYTFFKTPDVKASRDRKDDLNSLWAFQDELEKLGHFYTGYDNIEHLKRQFRDQLDKLLK